MTTIAYRDGVVAFDSRVSADGTIQYDDFDKSRLEAGHSFFFSGKLCDISDFVRCWFGAVSSRDLEAYALVYDGKSLWYASHSVSDGVMKCPLLLDAPYSIGSGSGHALTAMDMGADAEKAVDMAARRDTCTGGRVRTFKL